LNLRWTVAFATAALAFAFLCACERREPTASGAAAVAASSARMPGTVDAARLANAASEPGQWFTAGRDAQGTYFSPLTAVNTQTVSQLGFAWEYKLGTYRGLEATPVVVDGVMYTSGNYGRVYALEAATGKPRWVYDPQIDPQSGRYACCDAVNRGVAVWKGRVYVAALDGYLHAVDAATGQRLWKSDTLPARGPHAPYTSTGAPLVAGNLIVIGGGGGDFHGVRGFVAAFDLDTGQQRWRFYTVPRNPALGDQDQPHLVQAVRTWDPRHRWETGAGGAVWDGLSYDPALDLVYLGTGNPSPYDIKEGGRTGGDDLYADSIIALHADSGQLAWYFQSVPSDMWDFDSTQKMILADLDLGQGVRKVLMQAAKNGFFYVLDRSTGAFISANNFAYQNWTLGLEAGTGRPVPNPAVDYSLSPKLVFPWEGGAHGWQPMAYDPQARRVYIPVQESPNVIVETARRRAGLVEGQFTSPAFTPEGYDPAALASLYGPLPAMATLGKGGPPLARRGFLRSWDPVRNQLLWEVPTYSVWDGGVMSSAGGLVFQGDAAGALNIYAADSGKPVRRIELGTSVMAAPMSYEVGGVQYIAVMAGYGGGEMGLPFPDGSAARRYGNEGRIIALRLGGGAVPMPPEQVEQQPPPPPPRAGTRSQIAAGEVLYNRYCSRCHVFGQGMLPDLRRLAPQMHERFSSIVLEGALSPLGMGRFDDVLTPPDVAAIHAYLIDEAWKAWRAAAPGAPAAASAH
jgi:quinohemoprotein ethanol dehydrogenase